VLTIIKWCSAKLDLELVEQFVTTFSKTNTTQHNTMNMSITAILFALIMYFQYNLHRLKGAIVIVIRTACSKQFAFRYWECALAAGIFFDLVWLKPPLVVIIFLKNCHALNMLHTRKIYETVHPIIYLSQEEERLAVFRETEWLTKEAYRKQAYFELQQKARKQRMQQKRELKVSLMAKLETQNATNQELSDRQDEEIQRYKDSCINATNLAKQRVRQTEERVERLNKQIAEAELRQVHMRALDQKVTANEQEWQQTVSQGKEQLMQQRLKQIRFHYQQRLQQEEEEMIEQFEQQQQKEALRDHRHISGVEKLRLEAAEQDCENRRRFLIQLDQSGCRDIQQMDAYIQQVAAAREREKEELKTAIQLRKAELGSNFGFFNSVNQVNSSQSTGPYAPPSPTESGDIVYIQQSEDDEETIAHVEDIAGIYVPTKSVSAGYEQTNSKQRLDEIEALIRDIDSEDLFNAVFGYDESDPVSRIPTPTAFATF
jgi:DNA segregation ATPase FtsK/SpoIIIE-like protein